MYCWCEFTTIHMVKRTVNTHMLTGALSKCPMNYVSKTQVEMSFVRKRKTKIQKNRKMPLDKRWSNCRSEMATAWILDPSFNEKTSTVTRNYVHSTKKKNNHIKWKIRNQLPGFFGTWIRLLCHRCSCPGVIPTPISCTQPGFVRPEVWARKVR